MENFDVFAHSLSRFLNPKIFSLEKMSGHCSKSGSVNHELAELANNLEKSVRSFIEIGPVYTPEKIDVPAIEGDGQIFDRFPIFQRRFCLTVVRSAGEIKEHMKTFGPVTFCFDPKAILELGPIPVLYFPQIHKHSKGGFDTSLTIVHEIRKVISLLRDLELLAYSGKKKELDKIENSDPRFIPISNYRKYVSKLLSIQNLSSERLKQMERSLHVASACMYPSGSSSVDLGPFEYFQEREWRIMLGTSVGPLMSSEEISDHEQRSLSLLNPEYFDEHVDFLEGHRIKSEPRIRFCRKFSAHFRKVFFDAVTHVFVDKFCKNIQAKQWQCTLAYLDNRFDLQVVDAFETK